MKYGRHQQRGFTIVELVIVIVISGILSLSVMQFISVPVDAYVAQTRRAELVEIADMAIDRISLDVHAALPNSLRVGCGGLCVEYLRAVSGGRYRASPPGDVLSFLPSDGDMSFDILGPVSLPPGLSTSATATACAAGQAACLVVYNTGFSGTDAWQGDNIATLTAVSTGSISFDNTQFSSGQRVFPAASPGQRFFVVDTPVTFMCDIGSGLIRRYEGYSIESAQTAVDTHAELIGLANPAEFAVLADRISDCAFSYRPGTPTRNGVLTVQLTVSEAGERVRLLQQIGVMNGI